MVIKSALRRAIETLAAWPSTSSTWATPAAHAYRPRPVAQVHVTVRAAHGDADPPAARREPDRVVHEIPDDLSQQDRIDLGRRLTGLCGLLITAGGASTQEVQGSADGGMGFFQAGYMGLDLSDLNRSLSGAGYPSLDESFLTLGGAGFGVRGRFLIGGEGHALLGRSEATPDGVTRLSAAGGYGLFRLGYKAISRAGMDVFPTVGIGGGGTELKIAERSAPTFDDILADPQRSAKLSSGMFLLDASVALTYRITVRESDEGEMGGPLVGVQVGYTFAPGSTSWTLDDINSVAGGPKLEVEGLHVEISFGGWGSGHRGP